MLRYEKVKVRESQFQSLVGLCVEEFELLHNYYEVLWTAYITHFTVSGQVRQRPHRKRKDGKLEDSRDQLLFILHFLKSNALQQHHAATYEMPQPQANRWIQLLLILLTKTLKNLGQLPERKAHKIEELLEKVEQVFVDGVEREIPRPRNEEAQKQHYSGKKRA